MRGKERTLRILRHADVHIAVLAVQELARTIGMSTGTAASLATAVSELTTNILKYANGGRITMRPVRRREQPGIEVIVEDKGPGIADIDHAMQDNVSTGGTLGLGLPGARRLADEFQITSELGKGTRVQIVKWG